MFAKRFFYASAAILCLALAFHIGARSARAQSQGVIAAYSAPADPGWHYVITPDGRVYGRPAAGGDRLTPGSAVFVGNFWGDGPIPVQQESFGSVKARYR
jgi:hypothetical protein